MQNAVTTEVALMPSRKWLVRIRLWDWSRGGRELVNGTSCRSCCSRRSVLTAEEQAWAERSPCPWERLMTPGGKQSNEAVSALALSAHTLFSRRKLRDKQQKRSFSIQEFLLLPFDRKSRPALPVFASHSPIPPPTSLRDEGTSSICLDEKNSTATDVPSLPSHPPLGFL